MQAVIDLSELNPGEKLVDLPIGFGGLATIVSSSKEGRLVSSKLLDFTRQVPDSAQDPPT